ncbi:hypothetical protein ACH4S8_26460 [Streptomyces sp. NPDC021080]|uniref:hypothetical protein n=1 Tax=Streptomyces sp. NPDC021080 TaxID=3365110 RepID=UPI0037A95A7A
MTISDSTDGRPLQFFPIDIGVYLHHPELETDPEIKGIEALLKPFGAQTEPWPVSPENRGIAAVTARLTTWSVPQDIGDTVLYWVGHGASDGGPTALLAHAHSPRPVTPDGIDPPTLLRHIKARQGRNGAGWAIVIIDACTSGRFVELLTSEAYRDGDVHNFLLVATSKDGSTTLGAFRRALALVLTVTFPAQVTIDLCDLARELNRNLHGCPVLSKTDTGRALLWRTSTTFAAHTQAPLDVVAEIDAVIASLTVDERRHFVPKASGAELGEQHWYFKGRVEERREILSWLDHATGGMLVVTGAAGSGKSALLGHVLVHSRRELSDVLIRRQHLDPLPLGSPRPYEAFDLVLHLTGATPREVMLRIAAAAGLPAPPEGPIAEQCMWLTQHFRETDEAEAERDSEADGSPFTILADALDEAHLPLTIAERLLSPLADLPGVRVVVGTRGSTLEGPDLPEPADRDIMDALGVDRERSRTVLLVDRDEEAMTRYIQQRLELARIRGELQAEPSQIDYLAKALGGLDRQFLYARLAVHEIIANPRLAENPEPLLEDDHRRLFARAVDRLAEQTPVNHALLEALALAQGHGLPPADGVWAGVATALASNPDLEVTDADIEELTRTAAPYLMLDTEFGQSVYRLAHRTFAEHFSWSVPLPSYDPRHSRITEHLAGIPDTQAADGPLNPYLAEYLPAHAGLAGPDGWRILADRPHLLDSLNPAAVTTSIMLRALGRFEVPPELAGFLSASEHLSTADPRDRRGLRELAGIRSTGESVVPRGGGMFHDPRSAWSVRWGHLKRHAIHLPLTAHTGRVRAVAAFEGSGGRVQLATGGEDGAVRIWDPAKGEATGEPLVGHDGAVHTVVAFEGSGGRVQLATGGEDKTVRIWDPVKGEATGEPLVGHKGWVYSVAAFDGPDGQVLLASGGEDGTVRVWDPATGEELARGGEIVTVPTRDPDTGKEGSEDLVIGHTGPVYSVVAFDVLDGTELSEALEGQVLLATGGEDGTVRLWDPATCEEVWDPLVGHDDDDAVYSLAAFDGPDGQVLLASGGEDESVKVWDPATGEVTAELTGHTSPVFALGAFTGPDGLPLLAVGSGDHSVRLWDPANSRQTEGSLTGHKEWVRAVTPVALPGTRALLATGSDDGTLRIWPSSGGRPANALLHDGLGAIYAVTAFVGEEEQTLIAAVGEDSVTRVWDPADGEMAGELQTDRDGADYAVAVVTTREGDLLFAAGGEDGAVRLQDWRTGAMVGELAHVGAVRAMSLFTGLGGQTLLATAGEDGVVRLWDPLTEARVGELETAHAGGVRSMSVFTGLGGQTLLATAGEDGTVGLRNLMSGQDVGEPLRHCGGVTAVAAYPLSDREAMLVTGGDDETVRFWHCETGIEALKIPLGLHVYDVAFVDRDLALATAEGLVQVSIEAASNLANQF